MTARRPRLSLLLALALPIVALAPAQFLFVEQARKQTGARSEARPVQKRDAGLQDFGFQKAAGIGRRSREIPIPARAEAEAVQCDES